MTAPCPRLVAPTITLAAVPAAVRQSRLTTARTLRLWDLPGLIDDAEIVVSELVTNAVEATGTTERKPSWAQLNHVAAIKVRVMYLGAVISIEVWDNDPTPPVPGDDPESDADGGRGLVIVAALSARWDYYPSGVGKVVWAELPVQPYPLTDSGLPQRSRPDVPGRHHDGIVRDLDLLRRVHRSLSQWPGHVR